MKEESESDSELNVDEDDEEDDIADQDDEEVSPQSSPRPLVPTPLLAGARPPFPGFVGLQDLIRPSFPHGPGVTSGAPMPPFPGMPNSLFDKGTNFQTKHLLTIITLQGFEGIEPYKFSTYDL